MGFQVGVTKYGVSFRIYEDGGKEIVAIDLSADDARAFARDLLRAADLSEVDPAARKGN